MSKEVMLSVNIPAYNAEKYLDDCMASVMTWQDASFEIVLINDGSTNGIAVICRKWADEYRNIIYIEQENQGQGTARNIADDYDILVFGQIHITKESGILWTEMSSCTEDKQKIMQKAVSVLWDKMFRRTLWKREQICLQNVFGEDVYPVYMLEAKAKGIRTKQVPLVCHYDRADNLTSRPEKYVQFVEALADTLKALVLVNKYVGLTS